MRKLKRRKRKTKTRKHGGEVFRIGGVDLNLMMIQVNLFSHRIYQFLIDIDVELDLEKVMSPDEKQKLYDAIGYEGEDTSTSTYPEEVRFLFGTIWNHSRNFSMQISI